MNIMEMLFMINNIQKMIPQTTDWKSSINELFFGIIIILVYNIITKLDIMYYCNELYYYLYDLLYKKNIIILSNKSINETSRGQSDYKYCPISYKALMYFLSNNWFL